MSQCLFFYYSADITNEAIIVLTVNSDQLAEEVIFHVKQDGLLYLVHHADYEMDIYFDSEMTGFDDNKNTLSLKSDYKNVSFDKSTYHSAIIFTIQKLIEVHQNSGFFCQDLLVDLQNETLFSCSLKFQDKILLESISTSGKKARFFALNRLADNDDVYYNPMNKNLFKILTLSTKTLVYEHQNQPTEIKLNIHNRFILGELNRLLSIAEFS